MTLSDAGIATKQIPLCEFCVANVWGPDGWAKFGITNAKLKDYDARNFKNEYNPSLRQLLESAKDGCWWCGHMANAILNEVDGQVPDPVPLTLFFQILKGREPRRLGLLLVDIEWENFPLHISHISHIISNFLINSQQCRNPALQVFSFLLETL